MKKGRIRDWVVRTLSPRVNRWIHGSPQRGFPWNGVAVGTENRISPVLCKGYHTARTRQTTLA